MLNREELEKYKQTTGFNIWQIERDYLQHLLLLFISKYSENELVFKGGTALQKCYGLNRFSIDLDFTLNKELPNEFFYNTAKQMTLFGFETTFEETQKKDSLLVKFKVKGPLYQGTEKTMATLRIEISMRERVLLKSETKEIFPVYPDIQPYLIKVIALEEILAEKIRAILTRNKARDIYDVWFLLNKNVKLDKNLIDEKLGWCNLKFDIKELFSAIDNIKNVWDHELKQLMERYPKYDDVKAYLKKTIKIQ